MGKVYRTAQGRQLDMETVRLQNELVPAIGNMRVNARGDQLGPGGQIVKTREMIMDEFYANRAAVVDNVPQEAPIPTRSSPSRRKSDPLPTSNKTTNFTPETATPDEIMLDPPKTQSAEQANNSVKPETETKLKGGLAAAIAKSQTNKKKVKRID